MLNSSTISVLPPLPSYTLTPLPPLVPPIPDKLLVMILPFVAYWVTSLIFHWFDTKDLFSKYRLHTPAEVLARNHATRWEVFRDVIVQQIIQTAFGILLGWTEPDDLTGRENYDVSVWATRIRVAQRVLPSAIALFGLDAAGMAKNLQGSYPILAGLLSGGSYSGLVQEVNGATAPAFARWEMLAATGIYYYIVPFFQFALGILFVDTWQYFLHRGMHMNKWLYTTLHSRHHRLYIPYAYGALYNHPIEGFMLDTFGTGIAFKLAGMTTRQGMWFFTCSTIKTVDDHCGYAFPWDPLQHVTENNAAYHDIHHQSWGIKSNFSQPFSTFWDRILGTNWTGGDVSARYERARIAAQKRVGQPAPTGTVQNENTMAASKQPQSLSSHERVQEDAPASSPALLEEAEDGDHEPVKVSARHSRRKAGSDGLKGLRDRVTPSLHGRSTAILGMESGR